MTRWTEEQVAAQQAKVLASKAQVKGKAPKIPPLARKPVGTLSKARKQDESGMIKRYQITPIPKPRLTRQGRFTDRAKRYYQFAEDVREFGIQVPESGAKLSFFIPMPKSWTKKKKAHMIGTPHQQTPDIDNLIKAVLDAIYEDDKVVWDIRASKHWAVGPVGAIWVRYGKYTKL